VSGAKEAQMCLGVPGRVMSVEGQHAWVDFWGVRKRVRLDVVDAPVEPGDYVLNHVGYAIRRIPEQEIRATLELYEALLRLGVPDDLMASDVASELQAATPPARTPRGC
jgi:hydrogenase expression/formation protein HypC